MIKLAELVKLKKMVYTESISDKHKKRLKRKTPSFHENIVLPYQLPPDNDSNVTLRELKYLAKIKPNPDLVNKKDDVVETFFEVMDMTGVKVDKDYIKQINKESVKFIFELKYKYNRPRPFQLAEVYDMDLNGTRLDSMKTPSFPSGHAVQGYFIAEVLSLKDPRNSHIYRQVGEDIAQSRIIGKAHYPSDKKYGKKVAKALFKGLK